MIITMKRGKCVSCCLAVSVNDLYLANIRLLPFLQYLYFCQIKHLSVYCSQFSYNHLLCHFICGYKSSTKICFLRVCWGGEERGRRALPTEYNIPSVLSVNLWFQCFSKYGHAYLDGGHRGYFSRHFLRIIPYINWNHWRSDCWY